MADLDLPPHTSHSYPTLNPRDRRRDSRLTRLAIGGLLSMAAAFGIGRFAYTPILPPMIDALGWSKSQAGLVASANFIGYLFGAIWSYNAIVATRPRQWLIIALCTSGATTAAMGLVSGTGSLIALRFVGGAASALVIVCASTLVLNQLEAKGRFRSASVHF